MALAYYQKHLLSFVAFLLLVNLHVEHSMGKEVVPVGVVLDLNSTVGGVAERCMSMALSDFYGVYDYYNTRIALLTRDSGKDVIAAASAALDLMKNEEVHAIIGPQSSAQAKFVIELGRKAQVPIISFSATSPSLSPAQNPFFIRTALDDSAEVKAIAAIVKAYGWREIVLIYEDTDYGNDLIPYLMDAFEEIETRMPYRSAIPPFSNNSEIAKEIKKLNETNARIFLVHMTASLGSKLFALANSAGMMREGYAWIITEGLSALFGPLGPKVKESMQGAVGLRPYIPRSKQLDHFKRRWKRINLTSSKANVKITGLNLFGLWAYDTAWALAMAVEKAGTMHVEFWLDFLLKDVFFWGLLQFRYSAARPPLERTHPESSARPPLDSPLERNLPESFARHPLDCPLERECNPNVRSTLRSTSARANVLISAFCYKYIIFSSF